MASVLFQSIHRVIRALRLVCGKLNKSQPIGIMFKVLSQ